MGGKEPPNPADEYLAHASDLLTQTVVSLLIGGTAFLWFCLLRFRWPDVYAARARLLYAAPARMGKTFLGWIGMVLEAKDFEIMYSVGLDALLVLRLFKMLGALSATASIIGLFILVPIKVWLDPASKEGGFLDAKSLYNKVTTAAMGSERPLVVHFAFAYVFTALVYFYFGRFAYQAISLRWHYLLRVRNTRPARSIMVTGIPKELAEEQRLRQHFETGDGLGSVVSVEIVPRIERLGVLVRRRSRLLKMIEEQVTVILGNPCSALDYDRDRLYTLLMSHGTINNTEGIDGEQDEMRFVLRRWSLSRYHTQRGLRKLERMMDKLETILQQFHHSDSVIQQVRHEWFASYDGKRERSSTVGFVTFADASSAHLAAQSFTYSQPFQLRAELAPEPRDIFWDNITLPLSTRLGRGVVSLVTYMLMLLYWLTMAFLLSAFVSLDSLKKYFPWLPELTERNKWLKGFFQYTTPTLVLSLMNACVPHILSWFARLSGIQSRSSIQKSVLRRYFMFLISNVLLIFTVSRAILTDYEKWIENPALIPKLLATRLPTAAPFFMDYVILYGLGYYPIQLLQIGSISLAMFRRMVCRTPRQFADAMRPNHIDWAFILPQPMLVFVIMATYSSLAPLVFLLAAMYYLIAYVVTKYLAYYVYARQFETAGEFIIPVLKLLTGSLWHYYCLIIGLCALKGAIVYVLLLLPLLWINWYLLSKVSRQFYEHGKFVPLDMWNLHSTSASSSSLAGTDVAGNSQSSENPTNGTIRPSQHTSTDYLLPNSLSPFGVLLDSIDSEYRGVASWIWEMMEKRLTYIWALVFSKIYIDPQRQPDIFRDLDRCYSINGQDILLSDRTNGMLRPSISQTNYSMSHDEEYDETSLQQHLLQVDDVTQYIQQDNIVTPRFSTTFEDNGGDDVSGMRAELMLGRDQRESKIEPDEFTDFEQSPILLLDGVLDQGLSVYEHPYLIGNLPTLWLPMRKSELP
ncbi:DUF221-domain-containing protein [Coemansia reversa NRRL 1564]|uniref:DUF221-domain-containing protein n=1 Tax=Coemansia reversa (strain ATCC 12441 / NRRL 1564) TaxID=763665 RepID=A0A2G5B204_COERN|nr:DUF221-domain-containing protein [Coemansia reversa NRRL 1564]|eukprot:PIA13035.1 DUF221-domain-containing protein [Coemansia reversa NRRL 1564]